MQSDAPQNTFKVSSLAPRCLTDLPSTCPREDSPRQGRGGAPQRPQGGGWQLCSFRGSPADLATQAASVRGCAGKTTGTRRRGICQALETRWICLCSPTIVTSNSELKNTLVILERRNGHATFWTPAPNSSQREMKKHVLPVVDIHTSDTP